MKKGFLRGILIVGISVSGFMLYSSAQPTSLFPIPTGRDFTNLLSTENKNTLTAEMWDKLVKGIRLLTHTTEKQNVILADHEARIKALEGKPAPDPYIPPENQSCSVNNSLTLPGILHTTFNLKRTLQDGDSETLTATSTKEGKVTWKVEVKCSNKLIEVTSKTPTCANAELTYDGIEGACFSNCGSSPLVNLKQGYSLYGVSSSNGSCRAYTPADTAEGIGGDFFRGDSDGSSCDKSHKCFPRGSSYNSPCFGLSSLEHGKITEGWHACGPNIAVFLKVQCINGEYIVTENPSGNTDFTLGKLFR